MMVTSFRGSGNTGLTPEGLPMLFSATIVRDHPWTVIHLAGELDLLARPVGIGIIDGVMNTGSGRIILDFADLTLIDTSGATALLRMEQKAERTGIDLVVVNPSPLALQVLQVCGFRDVIQAPMALAC